MTAPEFSRTVRIDTLSEAPRRMNIETEEAERIGLARRFGLIAIHRLTADLALSRQGAEIALAGTLCAQVTQACVATGAPLAAEIAAPFDLKFRPQPGPAERGDELELGEAELDVIFYDEAAIDVGEAVAETLLLNLDPYPRAPGAQEALKEAGVKSEAEAGPFGALAGLRDKLSK